MAYNKHISMEQAGQNAKNAQRGIHQNPYIQNNAQANPQGAMGNSLMESFDSANFIKGALIGAVGAYLLTNENAQKTLFKGIAKSASLFQVGMEEMKERFEDAQAELEAEQNA